MHLYNDPIVEDTERLRTLLGKWIVRYSKCYYYLTEN